jgi:Family of unknown function (DUF6328)
MKEVAGQGTGGDETGEGTQERSAREVVELLQELRIVLPGVQVLFAFLLTVPFTQQFAQLTTLQQNVFFATLRDALVYRYSDGTPDGAVGPPPAALASGCQGGAVAARQPPYHPRAAVPDPGDGRRDLRDHRPDVRIADRRRRDGSDGRLICPVVVLAPVAIPLETPTREGSRLLGEVLRGSDGTLGCRRDEGCVFRHHAGGVAWDGIRPPPEPLFDFVGRQIYA